MDMPSSIGGKLAYELGLGGANLARSHGGQGREAYILGSDRVCLTIESTSLVGRIGTYIVSGIHTKAGEYRREATRATACFLLLVL